MDEQAWDKAIEAGGGDFFQSTGWGAFQRVLGRHVEHVQVGGACAQIIFRPLPAGADYAYIPMGPVPAGKEVEGGELLEGILQVTGTNTVFIECDLLVEIERFVPTTEKTRQPRRVHIVSLNKSMSKTLLSSFHPTLEQNIERALHHNLDVRKENSWEGFFALYLDTIKRHSLRPWGREYMRLLWETLLGREMLEIWSVYHDGTLLASNLYVLFGGRATHLFGGSSEKKRNVMAPHFLHWKMMSTFAERGIKEYDLGKVDAQLLPGLTQFKERFCGVTRTYPGNFRYPLRPLWYRAYTLIHS